MNYRIVEAAVEEINILMMIPLRRVRLAAPAEGLVNGTNA
jgi:hypothetical protein